jgi:hypothetical protein
MLAAASLQATYNYVIAERSCRTLPSGVADYFAPNVIVPEFASSLELASSIELCLIRAVRSRWSVAAARQAAAGAQAA